METVKICPNCRKPLPPDVPLGLCPECLIKAGFPTGTEPGAAAEAVGARFVPPPVAEIAQLFPQLEILRCIGQGGMGAVYKARQPALDRFVALKVLPPAVAGDPGFAERFNREARALARLNHPNIVAVHDFGRAGALHYLLMEFVDGANLREVERLGELTPEQALAIVPQICEALQFAHNEGIVHRDIKPENLLLDKKGRVKITDFGIAKMVGVGAGQQTLTGARDVVGTPHYMAPEQIEKPLTVDHRADIYSLGVVFYEMLTGELPLGKFQPPSKRVQIDVRLDEVVLQALEKEPDRRYQHASQVKTAVETITTTPSGGSPKHQDEVFQTAEQIEAVRRRLKIPARGLIAAAGLQLLTSLGLLVFAIPAIASAGGDPMGYAAVGFGAAVFMIFATIILLGAASMRRLRNYPFSMVASVVAAVAGPGAIVGLPFGIWACVELIRPEVRAAFAANRPPTGPSSTPDSAKINLARAQVKGPAIGLVVTGVLNWVAFTFFLIVFKLKPIVLPGPIPAANAPAVFVAVSLLTMVLSGFILYAGLKIMRLERRLAGVAGGILAMIVAPASIIGLPIGIWALVVLNRPEVKAVFESNGARLRGQGVRAKTAGAPRSSGPALVGAFWTPLFLASFLTIILGQEQFPQGYGGFSRVLLLLGLAAPVTTTLLGWLAVAQIRRSEGKFHGMELALFDSLLFPLLGLDVLIGIFWLVLAKNVAHWRGLGGSLFVSLWDFVLGMSLLIIVAAAVDFLIARRIWRWASQPPGREASIRSHRLNVIRHALTAGILALGLVIGIATSLIVSCRNVDNVKQPFADDPPVVGRWTNVDFVRDPEDFKPGIKTWKGDLPVFQNFTVYPDGRTSYQWLDWTKNAFINRGEKTAGHYEIRTLDRTDYLFVEWKNADYILFHSKPWFFVLRRTEEANTNFDFGQAWFPRGDSIEIISVDRTTNRMTVKGRYHLVSHDNALLALYLTTMDKISVPVGPDERMQISKGGGEFELVDPHPVPGLPHVSMYDADGQPFASLYFGTKAEALEESKAGWITNGAPDPLLQFRRVLPPDSTEPADWLPSATGSNRFHLSRRVLLDEADIARAGVEFSPDGRREVEIRLTDTGAQRFEEITATNIGRQLAIVFRDRVLSAPVIASVIPNGLCQVNGTMNAGEVNDIVDCLNRTATPTAKTWNFSPVRERILPLQSFPHPEFGWLDLDSGTVLTNSTLDWQTRSGHKWIQANGLDVVTTESSKTASTNYPTLLGLDSIIAPAPAHGWDIATAADVVLHWAFLQNEPQQKQILGVFPGRTDTFFFQTREGGKGILQILGFADNPPGVKIRYKLVQAAAPGMVIDPATGLPNVRGNTAIDPTTGLPMSAAKTGTIDPATGLPVTPAAPKDVTNIAAAAAGKWLALIDSGNYPESWKEASAIVHGAVTETAFVNSMNTFRQPLGDLVSRRLKSAQPVTELPGVPDGQYVVMQFDTSFTNKKNTIETVTFMLEKDGNWKAAGYYIK